MSSALLMLLLQTMSATNVTIEAPMPGIPEGAPTWSDEFDGTKIDHAKWSFDGERNKLGWYNDEKQYYAVDRHENARVEQGNLIIEARRETLPATRYPDWGGQSYTSAKLVSRVRSGYGFYEIRAKLPCGRGTWPALWMLPEGGTWPDAGEIDIMEAVGWNPDVVHGTVHSGLFNHAKGTQRGAQRNVPTACTAFHRYQLDWQPKSITIGVDGRAYMQVLDDQPGGRGAWPFTTPYRMILNLAVGGTWGGAQGIDDQALPQRMEIDYVRYWKR